MSATHDDDLRYAASKGDLERVRVLIENGADPNAFDEDLDFTALHCAAKEGHVEVVKHLLSMGADVNAYREDKIGETPLGEIAANCSFEMAQLLVAAGADPTVRGWMGNTALDRARARKRPEGRRVFELLLDVARRKFKYFGD